METVVAKMNSRAEEFGDVMREFNVIVDANLKEMRRQLRSSAAVFLAVLALLAVFQLVPEAAKDDLHRHLAAKAYSQYDLAVVTGWWVLAAAAAGEARLLLRWLLAARCDLELTQVKVAALERLCQNQIAAVASVSTNALLDFRLEMQQLESRIAALNVEMSDRVELTREDLVRSLEAIQATMVIT